MLANTGSGLTERLFWVAGSALVVIYALIPVAWIVSLSLKPAADIGDNRFTPRIISLEHYEAVFGDPQFSGGLVELRRDRRDLDADGCPARHVRSVRHRAI